MTGRVVSIKMINTVAVLVTRTAKNKLYKKTYTQSKKYLVHDDLGVKMGDIVEIVKIRPVSKMKHWKVAKVVGRSVEEMVKEQLQKKAAEEIAIVMPVEEGQGESGKGEVVDQVITDNVEEPKKVTKKTRKGEK